MKIDKQLKPNINKANIKADINKNLGFGKVFTDHMFLMDANDGVYSNARILPYGPICLDPASKVLHYGQEVFEGLKAYKAKDGRILLFRPDENFKRMNRSFDRLDMPHIDIDFVENAMCELISVDADWIPDAPNTLYIRPFAFATDAYLGVSSSSNVCFCIILSPSGAYYANGMMPTKIYVEDVYVRAVAGGMGESKTGGNYAASLLASESSIKKGYDQVLWLDGIERKYIEEVGAMNIFFVVDGKVITPLLNGSVLSGVTRMSVMQIARDMGYEVSEERISIDDIIKYIKNGNLEEAFGTGTAAVISPVGILGYKNKDYEINNGEIGNLTKSIYDELTDIQFGNIPDKRGWTKEVIK